MKKVFSIILSLIICFALMLPISVSAASASAGLTGPGTVRAGDTITLSFNLNGKEIVGVSGKLSYDSSQVTLTGTSQKIGSPWMVEFSGNNFVAYDNNLTDPINSNKTIFTVTFNVKSVAAGTKINISCINVTATDGSSDINAGTITYSNTVAAPMSSNNNLSSLTVGNATISPTFSAGTTSYTASVPFDVSKLNVTASAADSKAKVSVNSPELTIGGTTDVTVTVTAENGAKKTYTISVKRAQDPNYVPSSDNNLSGISVEGFLLSPAFKSDLTQYVIWLPYETESVKIGGTPADSKATVQVSGGETLAAGEDTPVKIICTAENGEKKEYTVIAKRAAPHDAVLDTSGQSSATNQPDISEKNSGNIAWWWLIIVGILGAILGAGIMYLLPIMFRKKKNYRLH